MKARENVMSRVFVALVIIGAEHFQEKSSSHPKTPRLSPVVASERTRSWDIQSRPEVPIPGAADRYWTAAY